MSENDAPVVLTVAAIFALGNAVVMDANGKAIGFDHSVAERIVRHAKAEAWDEGHRLTRPHSDSCEPTCPNPYRLPSPAPTRHHTAADTLAAEDRVRAEDGHLGGRL